MWDENERDRIGERLIEFAGNSAGVEIEKAYGHLGFIMQITEHEARA